MKKILLPLLLLFFVTVAQAQTATPEKTSHYKAAEELLSAMELEKMTNDVMSPMLDFQIKTNPMLESKRGVMEAFFKRYMSWQSLKEDYIQVYKNEFTEGELKDITAFYRTPTGKKLTGKAGVLAGKGSEVGQQRVMTHMTELQEMLMK